MNFKKPYKQYLGKWVSYDDDGYDKEFLIRVVNKDDSSFFNTASVWGNGQYEYSALYPSSDTKNIEEFIIKIVKPIYNEGRLVIKLLFSQEPPWK